MKTRPSPSKARDAFSTDWLSLREPFDTQARLQAAKALRLQQRLVRATAGLERPLRIIDLGCGTGANLRWLAPRLGGAQQWLAVDHDLALLRAWPDRLRRSGTALRTAGHELDQVAEWPLPSGSVEIVRRPLDLARRLHKLPWQSADLVTASALIDLVSEDWLRRLVKHVQSAGAAVLMTLNVNGVHRWWPADRDDAAVGQAFAEHQQRDKGFGPALGAQAVDVLEAALEQAGYQVFKARSDWRVDGAIHPGAQGLYHAMVQGIGNAAQEHDPAQTERFRAWQARRSTMDAQARLTVGHLDLLALPPERAHGA